MPRHTMLGVLCLLSAGCATLGPQGGVPDLVGQVHMPSLGYRTQATIGEVGNGATVSLIDVAANQTLGTSLTTAAGAFRMSFGTSFKPAANTTYYLEAVKGLSSNRAGRDAARLRTLISYTAGGWVSLTSGVANGPINVTLGTTAVSVIVSHRTGTPHAVNALGLIGTVAAGVADPSLSPVTTDTFNGTADYPNLTNSEFHGVFGMAQAALDQDQDPMAAVSYDSIADTFGLPNAGASQIAATPAPATGASVGDTVTLTGMTFNATAANNVVTFNGVPATVTGLTPDRRTLTCQVPAGATTGPLIVSFDGLSYGLPTYVVLSTANLSISGLR
ncbi:MAG TPA: IPT/TIG domain-containing protein [Stenomitos sp.]